MKNLFLGIKYHADRSNRKLIKELTDSLEEAGFKVSCMTIKDYGREEETPAESLMEKTFKEIKSSDLVVIELSEKGVGLGIEAGYAYSLEIPVYTILREGSDASKTLKGISEKTIRYSEPEELTDKFKRIKGDRDNAL